MRTRYKVIIVLLLVVIVLLFGQTTKQTYANDTIGGEIIERGYDEVMKDYINPCWVPLEERSDPQHVYVHTWFVDWVCQRCERYVGPRYGFTSEDIYLLAQLLCGDASKDGDGEYDFGWDLQNGNEINYYEISKVLCVVMNRVRDPNYFPNTVSEVILQPGQFAVIPRNLKANPCPLVIEVVRAWCEAYDRYDYGIQTIPTNHLFFHSGPHLTNVTSVTCRR